jgi:hypothetical protein
VPEECENQLGNRTWKIRSWSLFVGTPTEAKFIDYYDLFFCCTKIVAFLLVSSTDPDLRKTKDNKKVVPLLLV